MEERLLAYLSRILGEHVMSGQQVALSSTQRVQLISWLNAQGVPADINHFKSNLVSIDQIMGMAEGRELPAAPGSQAVRPAPARPAPMRARPAAAPVMLGLGIDIQAKAKMPPADDFRTDSFYKGNFSDRELAHCIEKADPLESLAGIWAAKEAIIKAGAATGGNGALAHIEVTHDASGAPGYPGCLLSISHEGEIAVAVCIRCN